MHAIISYRLGFFAVFSFSTHIKFTWNRFDVFYLVLKWKSYFYRFFFHINIQIEQTKFVIFFLTHVYLSIFSKLIDVYKNAKHNNIYNKNLLLLRLLFWFNFFVLRSYHDFTLINIAGLTQPIRMDEIRLNNILFIQWILSTKL